MEPNEALCANSDQFFLIVNGMIVFLMQAGFAFLEAGSVRSKNTTNILFKNVLDSFIGAVSYWIIGWPLAYGDKSNAFCGYSNWAGSGFADKDLASWFFQYVFAATAATIISGAVAERCQLIAYASYSIIITGFAYPIVSHWGWDANGWLLNSFSYSYMDNVTMEMVDVNVPYKDFAGSGIVHMMGGTCALVAATFLGPRMGKFDKEHVLVGHSVPLASLGGFILFFGFFAFNGGSVLAICADGSGTTLSRVVANTIISGSFGAFSCLCLGYIESYNSAKQKKGFGKQASIEMKPKFSLLLVINGALAGMVAICADCDNMHSWAAMITGIIAGFFFFATDKILLKLKIDDPLSAVAVHLGGGIWGLLAAALFDRSTGIIHNGTKTSAYQLAANLTGAVAIMAWSAVISSLIFGVLKLCKKLRIEPTFEINGLDIPKHGEPAYPIEAYGDGWTNVTTDDVKKLHRYSVFVRSVASKEEEEQKAEDRRKAIEEANKAMDEEESSEMTDNNSNVKFTEQINGGYSVQL